MKKRRADAPDKDMKQNKDLVMGMTAEERFQALKKDYMAYDAKQKEFIKSLQGEIEMLEDTIEQKDAEIERLRAIEDAVRDGMGQKVLEKIKGYKAAMQNLEKKILKYKRDREELIIEIAKLNAMHNC